MTYWRYLMLVLLIAIGNVAHAQTFPKLSGRVVDAANLLSPEQVSQLTALSDSVEKASSRQLVVATIPDLQGYPIEDYGYKLGREWKIGQQGANNGIVLIVAPKERKVRIEVGYGLEPIMTDALSNSIVDNDILPKFKAGDMPGGIIAGAQAIADQMKQPLEAAEQRAKAAGDAQQTRRAHHGGGGIAFGLIFWIVVIAFILLARGRRGYSGQRHSSGLGEAVLWGALLGSGDRGGSGLGGGSWGGGGGSDWGGGGGGGFSGGGGSFGGGGASGSW